MTLTARDPAAIQHVRDEIPLPASSTRSQNFFRWGNRVRYSVIDVRGRAWRTGEIPVSGSPKMQDSSLTERYVVFYDLPAVLDRPRRWRVRRCSGRLPMSWLTVPNVRFTLPNRAAVFMSDRSLIAYSRASERRGSSPRRARPARMAGGTKHYCSLTYYIRAWWCGGNARRTDPVSLARCISTVADI